MHHIHLNYRGGTNNMCQPSNIMKSSTNNWSSHTSTRLLELKHPKHVATDHVFNAELMS